jgi:prophage maintenance system killer protein
MHTPTILRKAAALFHSINANHPFMNGNKRTAVIALDHFLIANDHYLALSNDEMYELAQDTAAYKERGLSQDQSLREITRALDEDAICMGEIRQDIFSDLVRNFHEIQDLIRNNPFVSVQE